MLISKTCVILISKSGKDTKKKRKKTKKIEKKIPEHKILNN